MKKNTLLVSALFLAALFITNSSSGQRIFKVTAATDANVKVFVTTDVSQADIKVKTVNTPEAANKDGLWYVTATAPEAMLKVFEVSNAADADVKIFYVTDDIQAGWVTTNKRQFFKGNK